MQVVPGAAHRHALVVPDAVGSNTITIISITLVTIIISTTKQSPEEIAAAHSVDVAKVAQVSYTMDSALHVALTQRVLALATALACLLGGIAAPACSASVELTAF